MNRVKIGILTAVLFVMVLLLVTWPTISLFADRNEDAKVISDLDARVHALSGEQLSGQSKLAKWYNFSLNHENLSEELEQAYHQLLDFGDGQMGYVQFPAASFVLPIYHENGEKIQDGVLVHMEGTSLPIGGRGNHPILSGQFPADNVRNGDLIYIHILGEVLVYGVQDMGKSRLGAIDETDVCTIAAYDTVGEVTFLHAVRLEPELERLAVESFSSGAAIDKPALAIAMAAALGAGMIPVVLSLIQRRRKQRACS